MNCKICNDQLVGFELEDTVCFSCIEMNKEATREMDIEWQHDYEEGLIWYPYGYEVIMKSEEKTV